jgi:hypothetical protein
VAKSEIFNITGVIFIVNIGTSIDDCGKREEKKEG